MKLFRFIKIGFFLQLSACTIAAPIVGDFKYVSTAGPTVAQEETSVTYLLNVSPTKCSLVATGFQTDEKIRCTAVEQKDATIIKFVSYEDGALLNAYGVEIYKKDAALFSLQEKDKKIITHWLGLVPDGVKKTTGTYFQAVP